MAAVRSGSSTPSPIQRISVPTGYLCPAAALCCACVPTCRDLPCLRAATRLLHPSCSDPRSTAAAPYLRPRTCQANRRRVVPGASYSATPIQWAQMVTRDSSAAHRSPLYRPVCGSPPSCGGLLLSRRSHRHISPPCLAHAVKRTRARRRCRPNGALCGLALAFGSLASATKSF